MLRRIARALAALLFFVPVAVAQDATSPNLQLLLMSTGLHPNDWGAQTNTNLSKVESAVTGFSTVSVTGGTLTLTNDQARYAAFRLSGALTSTLIVVFPSTPRVFSLTNATTGGYSVTVQCGAGSVVTIAQNQTDKMVCDGANVVSSTPANLDTIPVGTMFNYAGVAAPNANYALCDGSAISRSTYAALFNAISTTYGAGDGVTTFNVPDTRGRVVASLDGGTGRLNGWTQGHAGGAASFTLTTNEMPSHSHTVNDPGHIHSITDPGHYHGLNFQNAYAPGAAGGTNGGGLAGQTTTNTTGISINSHTTGITLSNNGNGASFGIVQPTLVANCIIRVQ